MKILALDSSGLVASVAIVEDEILIGEYTINYKKTHSQTLLPMLDQLKREVELDMKSIDYIAVAGGPGSFTGLRIGSATAKGLGLALKKNIISVPTVDALAYNFFGTDKLICPLMDARRNQVYTGIYIFEKERMVVKLPQCAISVEEMIEKVNELAEIEKKEIIYLGDGVPVYQDKLNEMTKAEYLFAPAHMNRQKASAVAALAQVYAKEGNIQTATEHEPVYLRLSQAERERMEKEKGKNL